LEHSIKIAVHACLRADRCSAAYHRVIHHGFLFSFAPGDQQCEEGTR
jgi:hypothetical protein